LRHALPFALLLALGGFAQAQTAEGVAHACRFQLALQSGEKPANEEEARSQGSYCRSTIRSVTQRHCPQARIDENAAVQQVVTYLEQNPGRAREDADKVLPEALAGQGCR
jgi:hypothetical protein